MQSQTPIWKTRKGKISIGVGAFSALCACCVFIAALSPDTSSPALTEEQIKQTAESIAWQSFTQTAEAKPTNTPTQTSTPLPSPTSTATTPPEIFTQQAQATQTAEISKYQPIDIRELITYPNDHIGELVIVIGRVFNVNSNTELQIMVGDGFDAVYIVAREPYSGIYEDDTIKVYGLIYGENCGENSFGSTICQPLLMDAIIEK